MKFQAVAEPRWDTTEARASCLLKQRKTLQPGNVALAPSLVKKDTSHLKWGRMGNPKAILSRSDKSANK